MGVLGGEGEAWTALPAVGQRGASMRSVPWHWVLRDPGTVVAQAGLSSPEGAAQAVLSVGLNLILYTSHLHEKQTKTTPSRKKKATNNVMLRLLVGRRGFGRELRGGLARRGFIASLFGADRGPRPSVDGLVSVDGPEQVRYVLKHQGTCFYHVVTYRIPVI